MKVTLVIVEGKTDEVVLKTMFKNYTELKTVFIVVNGDLTTMKKTKINNSLKQLIKESLNETKLKLSDIERIIQVTDTDGAFVKDKSNVDKSLLIRNKTKLKEVEYLINLEVFNGIKYNIYYFSKNLEHFIYNISDHLNSKRKTNLAKNFFDDKNEHLKFYKTIKKYSLNSTYEKSWDYILKGNNSLKRFTNINLLIESIVRNTNNKI